MTIDGSTVSVVMALHDGRAYVEQAIRSILAQTTQPGELIVVDDGSTDGSHEPVEAVEAPFPIKVVHQENRGQSCARNVGVGLANGRYIAFLDQDDEWRESHLALLLQAISKRPDVGWVYGDFDEIDSQGRTVTHSFITENRLVHPKRTLAACLAGDLMIIPSASLIRKDALLEVGGFAEDLCGYEDDELFVRVFRAGWKHRFVAKSLTRFRVHTSSSSSGQKFLESRMIYLDKLIESVTDDDRLNRYWVRDLVLPRFFLSTVDDYSRALSRRDWDQAAQAAAAAARLASMMPPRIRRSIEVRLMSQPKRCRQVLYVLNFMPAKVRRLVNPMLRLRPASRYAG